MVESLSAQVAKLESEVLQLRSRPGDWELKHEIARLRTELEAEKRLHAETKRRSDQHYHDGEYWKKALRHQQQLGKSKKVRHLGGLNEIRRAKFNVDGRSGSWINMERIFLKHWRRENKRQAGTNGGYGALELILSEDSNCIAAGITQRDATVAATVIQWLGTNCGRSFLRDVEREYQDKDRRPEKKGKSL
jgi:hypothetical protein